MSEFETLRVEALERVYEVFVNRIIDTNDPREFTAYLWTTIRRAMFRTIKHDSQIWSYATSEVDVDEQGTSCPELQRAATRLYISSFKKLVFSVFRADVRLAGAERAAALYFAQHTLYDTEPSANSLRFRFSLSRARARFVASYTRCTLKAIEHDVRQVDDGMV